MVNVAVFVSGSGSNCENLIKYFSQSDIVKIKLVLSNKKDALALQKAEKLGVSTIYMTAQQIRNPLNMMELMSQFKIDFIVLAGFLLVVPDFLIDMYEGKIINLHPALLPKFGGKGMYGHYVHEAVKAAGEKETGMTVHFVNNVVDGGQIIAQYATPILDTDSADDIARKEHELEMKYFPKVVEDVINTILSI